MYLSYVGPYLFFLLKGPDKELRIGSGIPMLGSVAIIIALLCWRTTTWLWAGIFMLLIDTLGPLWLAATILEEKMRGKNSRDDRQL